jgi:outer membrane immunogenic protein
MILSKKYVAIVGMICGLGLATAHAADTPNYKTAAVAPLAAEVPVEFSWTGFHLGLNAGGVKLHKLKDEKGVSEFAHAFGLSYSRPVAFIGGIQAGYDHQFGPIVLGLEGDANFSAGAVMTLGPVKTTLDRMFTVRARAGYAFGRALVYATGGWANAAFTVKADFVKENKLIHNGWTVGGGLEYALANHISVRGEYLYVSQPTNFSILRAGMNYKF